MFSSFAPRAKVFCLFASLFVLTIVVDGQTVENVALKVTVVDENLNLKNVPKFALVIRKANDSTFAEQKISTSFEGVATLSLPSGEYTVHSEKPLDFKEKSFSWQQNFIVEAGKNTTVELSNNNAIPASPRRRVSEEGEMFKTLRNGVVSVEGELGSGSGFIIDEKGLILTTQQVVAKSKEIRVRFDDKTAVKARLLAEDADRDLAVLQVNLSACRDCLILKIAEGKPGEPTVVDGERVFAIGSPLYQEKILTSGIASKLEERAIISDVNINTGNAGGPLFNSLGEVVGLTTFGIRAEGGPGIAGIVRIEETNQILSKAREAASTKGSPSSNLMPNVPEGTFSVETIKTRLSVPKFPKEQYISDVKNYQIKYMTPVFKFYAIEKDRLESLKERDSRNKQKGALDTADKFRDLRHWREYAGELRPVVEILALPETSATGKSMFLSLASAATIGISTPLAYKYKADFYQMRLLCSGREVTPIKRYKTEIGRELQNYYKDKKHFTYAGLYSYPHEIFEPGRCAQMQLHVFSEEDIETPIVSFVSEVTKARIWADFADYRSQVVKQ